MTMKEKGREMVKRAEAEWAQQRRIRDFEKWLRETNPPRKDAEDSAGISSKGDSWMLSRLMQAVEMHYRPEATTDLKLIDGERITVVYKGKSVTLTPDETAIVRYCWNKAVDEGELEFSMQEAILESGLPSTKATKLSKIFQMDRTRRLKVQKLLFDKVPEEPALVQWLGPCSK